MLRHHVGSLVHGGFQKSKAEGPWSREIERQVEASGRTTFGKYESTLVCIPTHAPHDLFEQQMLTPEDFLGYSFELEAG